MSSNKYKYSKIIYTSFKNETFNNRNLLLYNLYLTCISPFTASSIIRITSAVLATAITCLPRPVRLIPYIVKIVS